MTIPDDVECMSATFPQGKLFVWRAGEDRINVMRAGLGKEKSVTGTARPIRVAAFDVLLGELAPKSAAKLKWKRASIDEPRVILARLPSKLARYLETERA
jgi:hypothetical protein